MPNVPKPEDWARQFAFFNTGEWQSFPEIGIKAIYPLAQIVVETISLNFRRYLERFPEEIQELLRNSRATLSEAQTAESARKLMTLFAHCADNFKTVSKRPFFGFGSKLLALRRLELLFREETDLLRGSDEARAKELERLHVTHFPEFVVACFNPKVVIPVDNL